MRRRIVLGGMILALGVARADDAGVPDAGPVDAASDAAPASVLAPEPVREGAAGPRVQLVRTGWRRTAGGVAMGVGASTLLAGALVFAFRFVDDQKTREAESSSSVLPVLLLGGGAAAAVGGILWLTAPLQPAGVALAPAVAPGFAALTLSGRF